MNGSRGWGGGLRQHTLQAEEEFLHVQATAIADQGAIRADHAVAGDEDGDGVGAVGAGRGTDALLIAQATGKFQVGDGLPVGDLLEFLPDTPLEIGALDMHGDVEVPEVP